MTLKRITCTLDMLINGITEGALNVQHGGLFSDARGNGHRTYWQIPVYVRYPTDHTYSRHQDADVATSAPRYIQRLLE